MINIKVDLELEPTPYLVDIMRQVESDILAKKTAHPVTSPQELVFHLDK